ncbi:ATP-binding protein [Aestuariispira insulae]|uniref:histidine kinase n=1 Tax=Aestuariispira insulae TaxID=1461337 RepID=A0A3D9HRJ9_9PROT|nr:ATP-binding protein [Aestuariispira insulae]RED52100.1 response regulator receiver domain-containing protein [Aestuariispira insulae]
MQGFEYAAQQKGLTLQYEMAANLPSCFVGDADRIRQVLNNLIGNAIKFTETGGISVYAGGTEIMNLISFEVRDTGIGIPTDKQATIFDSFSQVDDASTRHYNGTGLGTAISKELVELMGGSIWLESQPGIGSSFFFTISFDDATCEVCLRQDAGLAPAPAANQPGREFLVLVVDDIQENLDLCILNLNEEGHRVLTAENGQLAIRAYVEQKPDVILMDVQMPVMDGMQATREIRSYEDDNNLPRTPVIALTASVMEEERSLCLEAGMDVVAAKPVDFERVSSLMEELVEESKGRTRKTIGRTLEISDDHNWALLDGVADVAVGLKRWRNRAAYLKALVGFKNNHALSGFGLLSAAIGGDRGEALAKAHALKGLAGNLALDKLWDQFEQYEDLLKNKEILPGAIRQASAELTISLEQVLKSIELLENSIKPVPEVPTNTMPTYAELAREKEKLLNLSNELSSGQVNGQSLKEVLSILEHAGCLKDRRALAEYVDEFEFEKAAALIFDLAGQNGANIEEDCHEVRQNTIGG